MPESAVVSRLWQHPADASLVVACLERLHVLTETRFERALAAQELDEIGAIRRRLYNELSRSLEKR
jgi:hypothetical protein